MKKSNFLLLVFVLMVGALQAQSLTIYQGTPKVDGLVDDNDPWTDNWISQDKMYQTDGANSTMSSKFQMLVDDSYIYVLVHISDATPNNGESSIPEAHFRDCAEFFFSMKSSDFATEAYVSGDHQIRIQRYSESDAYVDGNTTQALKSNMIYAITNKDTSWTVEVAFPISDLVDGSNFDQNAFRFECAATDNFNGASDERSMRYWVDNTNVQWKNTSVFGAVTISSEAAAIEDVQISSMSAYVCGEELKLNNINGLVQVYNVAGQLELEREICNSGSIGISTLEKGIYIVRSKSDVVKVIK